jgi:hypothetical protein
MVKKPKPPKPDPDQDPKFAHLPDNDPFKLESPAHRAMRHRHGFPFPIRASIGRPLIDPADLRSERFGFRLHPDLMAEASRLSRLEGLRLSIFCERALIAAVNQKVGSEILDAIGRYKAKPPKR